MTVAVPQAAHMASQAEALIASVDWTDWPRRMVRIEDVRPQGRVSLSIPVRLMDRTPTGTVLMRVHIDEAGRTRRVGLLRSSGHPNLDEAAMQSAWKTSYRPYEVNGQPEPVTLLLPMRLR